MIINEIINRMTGNSNKEDHKDFFEEAQRIIIDERNKYVSDYENGKIRHLKSEVFQKRIIKRLKKKRNRCNDI